MREVWGCGRASERQEEGEEIAIEDSEGGRGRGGSRRQKAVTPLRLWRCRQRSASGSSLEPWRRRRCGAAGVWRPFGLGGPISSGKSSASGSALCPGGSRSRGARHEKGEATASTRGRRRSRALPRCTGSCEAATPLMLCPHEASDSALVGPGEVMEDEQREFFPRGRV